MTTITLKLEEQLKKEAHFLADETGVSLSSLIKMILKEVIRKGGFTIDTKPKKPYHTNSEGTMVFKDGDEAVKYFKELARTDGNMGDPI